MTDTQKQNIEKLRLQGMGYRRIANALDIPMSTVKSHCQRYKLPVGEIIKIPAKVADKTICKQCGKPLEQKPKAKPKFFCCDKCRYDYWNNSPAQRDSLRYILCAGCGTVFTSYESRNRKYCGHSCYINHRFPKGELIHE